MTLKQSATAAGYWFAAIYHHGILFAILTTMLNRIKNSKFWIGVPPWIFIGAVLILLPIVTFITFENIHRQKEHSTRLLREKGAALIRSFEAGTRTGMMGMNRTSFQLQRLLTETAQQPDIVYLLMADSNGTILAHDNLDHIDAGHGKELDLKSIASARELHWRIVTESDGRKIFEVFRRFSPTRGGMGIGRGFMRGMGRGHRGGMGSGRMMPPESFVADDDPRGNRAELAQIIFVGLDMTSIEEARIADTRHSLVMGLILLLVGFAGIILLFLKHGPSRNRT